MASWCNRPVSSEKICGLLFFSLLPCTIIFVCISYWETKLQDSFNCPFEYPAAAIYSHITLSDYSLSVGFQSSGCLSCLLATSQYAGKINRHYTNQIFIIYFKSQYIAIPLINWSGCLSASTNINNLSFFPRSLLPIDLSLSVRL